MARTTKHVLGNQRGQIGEIVGRVVDGVQIYSAHTDAVKNPRSRKQVSHRARFAAVTTLGRSLYGAINVGFRNEAASQKLISPFNIFVKTNMASATYDASTHVASIDYEHIILSRGIAPFVGFSAVTFNEARKATATFDSYADTPGANDDDTVYLVVYIPQLDMSTLATALRSDGSVTATLPTVCGGKTAQVWGFARTSVEEPLFVENFGLTLRPGDCSNSSYIGSGTILSV